ncbi:MAG: hypothetical protein ISR90_05845 [Candidatus Marinimicrobia bacterium]|nr:hypothetical protein [Candidatus Neomarinimicrobiota bacterium]MBL7023556.1 hypothetical protein [Candidatus Neomarinimicrobiota bacterium]
MLRKSYKIILTITFLSIVFSAGEYGGAPNTFYQTPITPREIAMGNTGVASSQGVFSTYWNPAGLNISQSKWEAGLIFRYPSAINIPDINDKWNYWCGGVRWNWTPENINFAFNFLNLGISEITQTSIVNGDIEEIGSFNSTETMMIFSSAKSVKGMNIGLNVKTAYRSYSTLYSKFYLAGSDFGIIYSIKDYFGDFIKKKFLSLDFGSVIKLERDIYNVQKIVSMGISGEISKSEYTSITINLDTKSGDYILSSFALGCEVTHNLSKVDFKLFFRSGIELPYNQVSNISSNSFGIGFGVLVNYRGVPLIIDIAYSLHSNEYKSLIDSPIKIGMSFNY